MRLPVTYLCRSQSVSESMRGSVHNSTRSKTKFTFQVTTCRMVRYFLFLTLDHRHVLTYYIKYCVKSLFSQTNNSFKEYLMIKSSKFKKISFYNLYIFFAKVKLLLVFEKGLVVRDCEYISLLVSAEASTGDSVVGRVTHNYAHPSEYSPTCYYRRNARSPWQNAHLSRVLGGKG